MINPYDTTYGSLLNTVGVEKALSVYINTNELNELEYEYPTPGNTMRSIFITGKNIDEQELPVWEHPIVLKTLKNVTVVISDARRYVKKDIEHFARLSDVVKDSNSLDFVILRSQLMKDFLTNDIGKHRAIFKPATTAMGVWLSGMIGSTISLDPVDMFNIEIATSVYANTLLYTKGDASNKMETIRARVISSKRVYQFSKKNVKEITDSYIIQDSDKIEELIKNVQRTLQPEKAEFITIDGIIGVMGNVWYGVGSSETPIIALENMPIWLTLLYSSVTNRSYQKSRIGQLLNKHSRVIDAKAIGSHFTNYLSDIKVD